MNDDKTMGATGRQDRDSGTGGYQPSLPTLAAGDQLPQHLIKESLERRLRSLTIEMDETRDLLKRFSSNSNSETIAACRRFLDDKYRFHMEMERIKVEAADHGRQLTNISRSLSLLHKLMGGDNRVSMTRGSDPSSLAHVDRDSVDVPKKADSVLADTDVGPVVAKAAETAAAQVLGTAMEGVVQDAVAEVCMRIEGRVAELLSKSLLTDVPPGETPPAENRDAEAAPRNGLLISAPEDTADGKKRYGPLRERSIQDEKFGRQHRDFTIASYLAVTYVEKSSFPLSAKAISEYLRGEGGIDSFKVKSKDIGNRLLLMGLVRLKRKSGGTIGFWSNRKPMPEGWVV